MSVCKQRPLFERTNLICLFSSYLKHFQLPLKVFHIIIIDIACITETWLSNDDAVDINILQENGYQLSHIPRAKGRGGGVGVLYKSLLKLISVKPIHHADFEAINIEKWLPYVFFSYITIVFLLFFPTILYIVFIGFSKSSSQKTCRYHHNTGKQDYP